jgi:transcriptional enhancer factor
MVSSSVESSPSLQSATRHSAVDSFKRPPLQNPRTQDVFQSIVKGRKSWKTLRGGEVVWPPELEAALIEGLENYQPDDSRETRLLGRFPMRNRFISDWIFEKTGKRRTAKQVGSRLQQLRDTCGGKRLLNLLSPNRRPCRTPSLSPEFQQHKAGHLTYEPPSLRYESESCSDSSASSPTTPNEAHATLQNLLYRGVEPRLEETPDTIVYIDLLSEGSPIDNTGNTDDQLKSSWSSSSSQVAEERSWVERGYTVVRTSQHPRHLRDIDPTITFLSRVATSGHSYYTVWTDEGIIFSESTALEPLDTPATTSDNAYLYKTSLVPSFWETISHSSDASQYVIIQRVIQDASSPSASSEHTIFSAMYRFNYTSSSSHTEQTYLTPTMISLEPSTQKSEFSFDSLLPMDTEGFTDLMALQKSQNFFDVNSYMRSDWSTSSSTESVYPSPVDYNRHMPCIMGGGEQLVSPSSSFPPSEVPNYVLGS